MTVTEGVEIGRVLRAGTEGFTCGTRSQELHYPAYGAFVQTSQPSAELVVIGVITSIRIDDDPLVRQLIMATNVPESTLRDQRENRLVPVEIDVLTLGYVETGTTFYNLPPRPPLSLDPVMLCHAEDIEYFTDQMEFIRLIVNSSVPSMSDLLAATIRKAAMARHVDGQRDFLVAAGRRVASLLSHDLTMLQQVLHLIRPTA